VKASRFPENLAPELAFRLLGVRTRDRGAEGVVITEVHDFSYLAKIGVRPGDIIHRIDDAPIRNQSEFEKAVVKRRHKSSLVVLLQRGDQLYHLMVRI
jgi:S1-C subfamily serine protease